MLCGFEGRKEARVPRRWEFAGDHCQSVTVKLGLLSRPQDGGDVRATRRLPRTAHRERGPLGAAELKEWSHPTVGTSSNTGSHSA